MTLLEVKNLKTYYRLAKGNVKAIDGVSFKIDEGDCVGLVGESGCGKTTMAKSIINLLPENGFIADGSIVIDGRDILSMDEEELREFRWSKVSFVFQNAMSILDPVMKIGDQIVEAILTHEKVDKKVAVDRTEELLELVGIDRERYKSYSHELSGGMKQRVNIAMALALSPRLVIADEPTTALDVIVQDRVLKLISDLRKRLRISLLYISHDVSVVAQICDKVAVMYAGKMMEYGETTTLFKRGYHPYFLGLKNAFINIIQTEEPIFIPGSPPNLLDPPKGCRFYPRCPFTVDICKESEPEFREVESGHYVACHNTDKAEEFRELARNRDTWLNPRCEEEG